MDFIFDIINFLQKILNLIIADIEYLRWEAYFILAVIFLIPYFISRYFEAIFFRIICVLFGLSFLGTWQQEAILRDFNFLIGTALITPHIRYFYEFIKNIIFQVIQYFINIFISIKNTTINTYYFFLTVYYKTLRVINWIKEIFSNVRIFLNSKKQSNYSNSSYEQENNSYNNYEKQEYSYKEEARQEKYSYNDYNSSKNKERYKNSNSSKKEYKNSYTQQEEDLKTNSQKDKYARFYSPSAYIVLGVSVDDDMNKIKKVYRKLIREYHPDRNLENTKLYTEISQNINEAYDKLKKIHKV